MQIASAAGFYGKLPCKGDFLQRWLAQEFLDAWDPWLQRCLSSSREQLQERWLNFYLTSPVWRFAIAEGVCGSGAYAGVMVPSVDRVGRYFPLTVAVQLNTADCLLDLAAEPARKWFDAAESLLLGALEAHDLDLGWFEEQVQALGSPMGEADTTEFSHLRAAMQQTWPAGVGQPLSWQVPLQSVQSLQRAVNVFAALELERTLRPLTLWWTDGSEAVVPCWLCNRGLPAPEGFAAMVAGNWQNAAAPSVPAPPQEEGLSVVAYQAAVTRRVDAAPSVYFVSRPDVGLWGVATAQTAADILHDVPAAGSLTVLAEETGRALESLRRRAADARAVVFLQHSGECAVVCAGEVQAARVRSREVTNIEGVAAADADSLVVRYDSLCNGDVWVLSGERLFDTQRLATLPALFVGRSTIDDSTLSRLSRLLGLEMGASERDLPLMLLGALPG